MMRVKRRFLFLVLVCLSLLIGHRPVLAQHPPDLDEDIPWIPTEWWQVTPAEIERAFNNARQAENQQLGSSLPPIQFPAAATWAGWDDNQKALFLINEERTARELAPLEIAPEATEVATNYASWLIAHDAWGHEADVDDDGQAETPWDRLEANKTIQACHDLLRVAENLAVYVSSSADHLPDEATARAIYDWLYADASAAWGHRHTLLWAEFTEAPAGTDVVGRFGVSVQTAAGYQGPFSESWPSASLVVFNVYDPCDEADLAASPATTNPTPTAENSLLSQVIVGGALLLVVMGGLILRRQTGPG
ncbi:MAG: hypothetical protein H6651_18960 [Ardenticatenales bacterium]|nr:hypothetical protein [Ardenticatenales bacterium]